MDEIKRADGVLVSTHLNPDGDAIGAALFVSLFLESLKVRHEVICHNPAPYNLQFLPGVSKIKRLPDGDRFELAIVLDLESLSRLGSCREAVERCGRSIVIDHHIPVDSPGNLRIVSIDHPATCSILFDLVFGGETTITPDMANCLLTGLLTDTGNFRYPNTDAHALATAGHLLELGANLAQITEAVYMTRERPAFDLHGYALTNAKTACDGQIMWCLLPVAAFEKFAANEQHSEGIVNDLLAVKGVRIATVLREAKPGKIRGSLRSLGDIDVAEVARGFGGGGHANAAGVSFTGSIEEAESKLIEALSKCLAHC